jgi:hypothetical protein
MILDGFTGKPRSIAKQGMNTGKLRYTDKPISPVKRISPSALLNQHKPLPIVVSAAGKAQPGAPVAEKAAETKTIIFYFSSSGGEDNSS